MESKLMNAHLRMRITEISQIAHLSEFMDFRIRGVYNAMSEYSAPVFGAGISASLSSE